MGILLYLQVFGFNKRTLLAGLAIAGVAIGYNFATQDDYDQYLDPDIEEAAANVAVMMQELSEYARQTFMFSCAWVHIQTVGPLINASQIPSHACGLV